MFSASIRTPTSMLLLKVRLTMAAMMTTSPRLQGLRVHVMVKLGQTWSNLVNFGQSWPDVVKLTLVDFERDS
jgi:hypothetical protein